MKKIKFLSTFVVLLLLTSCSNKPSQSGEVTLKNGRGTEVTVNYDIARLQYDYFITQVKNNSELKGIIEKASFEAKLTCNFMPTYDPKEISLMAKNDTITVFVTFYAQNAFGAMGSGVSIFRFKGTDFIGSL